MNKDIIRAVVQQNGSLLNYTPEYKAVLDQMTNKPDAGLSAIYNTFVKTLVDGGVWSNLDLLNIKTAHTNANSEALLNWINPTGTKLSFAGSSLPVFTPFNGITGSGNGYIKTGFTPALATKYTQNNACLFFFKEIAGAPSKSDFGVNDGSAILNLATHVSPPEDGLKYNRINNIAITTDSTPISNYSGLWLINRESQTTFAIWQNKTKKVTKTINTSGIPNKELYELASNDASPAYSTATHSLLGTGNCLSDAQIATLNDAFSSLKLAISNAVQYDDAKWGSSVVLADYGTHKARSTFSEYSFNYSGTKLYVKSNPTIYANYPACSYLTIYVNGVLNQRVTVTDFSEKEISLPAGSKVVKIVTPVQTIPASTFIGVYPVSIRGFSTITPITPANVTDKIVFVGDSITTGGNATYPETQGYGKLFEVENGKNVAFHAWGYGTLAQMAGDAGKVSATVTHLTNLLANCTGTKKIVIALGTNDYGLNSLAAATFETYYAALLDAIHTADSSIVITCISPIKRGDAKEDMTLEDYRTRIGNLCSARATYCTHIYGKDLLTYPSTDYNDAVHPSITGHKKMKDAIYPIIYP